MPIDIVVCERFDELDARGPLEVPRSAAELGVDLSTRLVDGPGWPGAAGRPGRTSGPGARFDEGIGSPWGAAAGPGTVMATVSTGAEPLAHAGIVGSRRATTHRAARADLGATVVAHRVVDEGDLVACGGITAGLAPARWLVERLASAEVARTVATALEHTPVRPAGP